MSLESDEVNYLVYRYLLESGFTHSAFAFSTESHVGKSPIDGGEVPAGVLVTYLQRGLLYQEAETHVLEDGTEVHCHEPFSLVTPHVCKTGKRKSTMSKRERDERRQARKAAIDIAAIDDAQRQQQQQQQQQHQHTSQEKRTSDTSQAPSQASQLLANGRESDSLSGTTLATSATAVVDAGSAATVPQGVSLVGHSAEVFGCAWNPTSVGVLASASGDSTVRLFEMDPSAAEGTVVEAKSVLDHGPGNGEKGSDVTSLQWNGDGTLLATASYEGIGRIWSRDGTLVNVLRGHSGPMFAIKWNASSTKLVSASADKSTIVWNASTGAPEQTHAHHAQPVLDVEWLSETDFASCSSDQKIVVSRFGASDPLKTFRGHMNDVNAVVWNAEHRLLASCSDDTTAKIWTMEENQYCHDLAEHTGEIHTIKWCPASPQSPPLVATGSADSTVKVWDGSSGACLRTLSHHTEAVYSLAWSLDGALLFSGSFDHHVCVWRASQLVRAVDVGSGVYDVQSALLAPVISVATASGVVSVLRS